MPLAQRGRHALDVRVLFQHAVHHADEGAGIQLGLRRHLGAGDAQALLQILFVADDDVDVVDDAAQGLLRAVQATEYLPQLLAEVEIERDHGAGRLGRLHGFDDQIGRGRRQRGEDAAAVKPAQAAGHDLLPVEVARLQARRRLVRTVIEHHRRAHALAAIAVDGGDVRAGNTVVGEPLEEGAHAHGADALRDQIADGVVDHRRGHAGLQAEAVGQVGGHVELAAADVDLAFGGLAEGDDPRVQSVHHRAKGQEIQRPVRADVQAA